MKLAIVIPFYKITFFEETLKSLTNQTDKRFKLYIGDDASQEDPTQLLERYKGQFYLKYHRFESNLGSISLTRQWERCINLIDEDWVQILGDDDCLSPNFVESFYSNLSEINANNVCVSRFASLIIDQDNDIISDVYTHPKLETGIDFINRKFSKLTRSSLSEYVFKSDVVKQYKFYNFPLAWHSDDLAVLQFSNNLPIFSINEAVVKVRTSQVSITGDQNNIKLKSRATQDFILGFIFPFQNKLTAIALDGLQRKLEYSFIHNKSLRNYFRITMYYLFNFNLYPLIRFNYIQIKYIWK